jgi:hypothetical protein
MSERKCPVCGEVMEVGIKYIDDTFDNWCSNDSCPSVGDYGHLVIPQNYKTEADRLTARVAELEMELKSEKEQGIWWAGQCGKSDANANDLRRELAAAKAEVAGLKEYIDHYIEVNKP